MPNQNGAPIRIITPWKYGYKSIKAIVRIEFLDAQPPTFWNDLYAEQYGFFSNVDPNPGPNEPKARWSQVTETLIDTGEVLPTLKHNGYGEWVGSLYA